MTSDPAAASGPWPSGRKFVFALAGMGLLVPLILVNGWFAIGIPVGLVLAVLWWFDFTAELRASPPTGRAGRVLVVLAGVPQALVGLASLVMGLAIAAWLLWNLLVRREDSFEFTHLGGLFVVVGMVFFGLGWIRSGFAKDRPQATDMFEAAWTVRRSDEELSVDWPNGERQAIAWEAVQVVAIETNDTGPWGADYWTMLEGADGRVLWPQGATGEEGMLDELRRRYPGFDDDAATAALRCTQNARFVCWQRGT